MISLLSLPCAGNRELTFANYHFHTLWTPCYVRLWIIVYKSFHWLALLWCHIPIPTNYRINTSSDVVRWDVLFWEFELLGLTFHLPAPPAVLKLFTSSFDHVMAVQMFPEANHVHWRGKPWQSLWLLPPDCSCGENLVSVFLFFYYSHKICLKIHIFICLLH